MAKRGLFITLEGGEASGKSTNLALMASWLHSKKIPHVITHEPGGTPFAEKIRNLLLHTEASDPIAENTELLLMFASRAQHLKTVIEPALARGDWVICSRFSDSSYAYQGFGRGVDVKKISALESFAHPDLQPDLTILLDVPVEVAFERSKKRASADRIEKESQTFFERVRVGFLSRAAAYPERFRIIDATQPLDQVSQEVIELLRRL